MVSLSSGSAFPDQPAPSSVPESDDAITKVERDAADKAILLRCASGSEAAFQELYARLAPTLFAMIFEILCDQKDAEDVLQAAFVQLWKKAGAYDPARGTVFTWAVTIARRKAIDRFRASHRRHTLHENAAAEHATMVPGAVAPADDLLIQRDEGKRVRAALSEIPAAQSAAIQLAFFGGLTQPEMAQKLGAPLGTIKARLRLGLFALRDGLANNPGVRPRILQAQRGNEARRGNGSEPGPRRMRARSYLSIGVVALIVFFAVLLARHKAPIAPAIYLSLNARVDQQANPSAIISMFESKEDRAIVIWTEGLEPLPADYAAK